MLTLFEKKKIIDLLLRMGQGLKDVESPLDVFVLMTTYFDFNSLFHSFLFMVYINTVMICIISFQNTTYLTK